MISIDAVIAESPRTRIYLCECECAVSKQFDQNTEIESRERRGRPRGGEAEGVRGRPWLKRCGGRGALSWGTGEGTFMSFWRIGARGHGAAGT